MREPTQSVLMSVRLLAMDQMGCQSEGGAVHRLHVQATGPRTKAAAVECALFLKKSGL